MARSRRSSFLLVAVAQAVLLAAFILPAPVTRVAHACSNAMFISMDQLTIQVAEAQAALDEGDVLHARELTSKLKERELRDKSADAGSGLASRAERIWALSFVRDPDATKSELAEAEVALSRQPGHEPTLDADVGEALARSPDPALRAQAYALLEPLARRDLIGSPHALGALYRLANERSDATTAQNVLARCEGMIGRSPVCRGGYLRPPLIRGTTRSYLPPLVLAGIALGLRLLRSWRQGRKGKDGAGRPLAAPWIGHAARLQALAILGAGVYVFAHPSWPGWTTTVLAIVLYLGMVAERRGFFAAVRRGKIAGLILRHATAEDAHLPAVALYGGPAVSETLEQDHQAAGTEPGYREAARRPLLRLIRRPIPLGVSFAGAVAIMLVLLLGMLFVASLFLTMRGS